MRRMRLFTILSRAMSEMTSASSMNTMPRASRLAFVRRMRPMQTYMSTAHNQHVDYVRQLIVADI